MSAEDPNEQKNRGRAMFAAAAFLLIGSLTAMPHFNEVLVRSNSLFNLRSDVPPIFQHAQDPSAILDDVFNDLEPPADEAQPPDDVIEPVEFILNNDIDEDEQLDQDDFCEEEDEQDEEECEWVFDDEDEDCECEYDDEEDLCDFVFDEEDFDCLCDDDEECEIIIEYDCDCIDEYDCEE